MTYVAVKSMGRLHFVRKLFLRGYGYRRLSTVFAFGLCATSMSIREMMYIYSIQ